jgi:hypothetical protein
LKSKSNGGSTFPVISVARFCMGHCVVAQGSDWQSIK